MYSIYVVYSLIINFFIFNITYILIVCNIYIYIYIYIYTHIYIYIYIYNYYCNLSISRE